MSRKRRDDREHFEPKKQIRTESTLSESIAHGLLSISNFKTEDIPIGETINSRYVIQNFLGKGGFAKVIIAYDKSTCRQVAIKIGTAKEQFIIKQMTKEVLALRRLNHTNIIKAYDFYIDEKLCCIVMELVEGGELFDRLTKDKRRYTEHQAQHLAKTLISTINYIHSQHVVHR